MKPHTYRSSPVFEMTKQNFESFKAQVLLSIKTQRMALMSDGNTLLWIDEQLKRFEPEKKETGDKKENI